MDLPPGFLFHPSLYSPALGHPKVDIYLMSEPADRFFNTYLASFPVAETGDIKELQIEHPWEEWMGKPFAKVIAGRFFLREKDGGEHCGFSLGGEIAIQNLGNATLCTLSSSAPIFNLSDNPDSLGVALVDEAEALLAKRQAAWGEDMTGYLKRLAAVEPLTLFTSIVHTLDQEIRSLPSAVRAHGYQEMLQRITQAIHALEEAGVWPENIPVIQNIL